jgi:hypothetical protein
MSIEITQSPLNEVANEVSKFVTLEDKSLPVGSVAAPTSPLPSPNTTPSVSGWVSLGTVLANNIGYLWGKFPLPGKTKTLIEPAHRTIEMWTTLLTAIAVCLPVIHISTPIRGLLLAGLIGVYTISRSLTNYKEIEAEIKTFTPALKTTEFWASFLGVAAVLLAPLGFSVSPTLQAALVTMIVGLFTLGRGVRKI